MDEALAERLVRDCLHQVDWTAMDLLRTRKGDPIKIEIARQLRLLTPVTRAWIAHRLHMGSAGYLSQLLGSYDDLKL